MREKADAYELDGVAGNLLLPGSGIFALSAGDAVEVVTMDMETALLQTSFQYIDAFPKDGGARMVAVKNIGFERDERGLVNKWTSDF